MADKSLRKNKSLIGKNSQIYGSVINSSIGDNCIINGTVTNSIIMDKTFIGKDSFIKNSVIGENVNFNGKSVNSVIADNVKAENVVVKDCKIWPNKVIKNKTIEYDVHGC